MKKRLRLLSLCIACLLFIGCAFTACSQDKPTPPGQGEETPLPEPPGENPGGGDNPGETPENPGGGDSGEENPGGENPGEKPEDGWPQELFESGMCNTSKVGYSAKILGRTERNIAEISNGGLGAYPVYGADFAATDEEKQAVLDENTSLNASASTYDSMDAEGNLYLAGELTGKKLYRHSASVGMYEGDVSDAEPAVIKRITIQPRSGGNHITGLYAPAGEPIKIEMSEQDLAKTGGLTVYIGQVLSNGGQNNIWLARTFNRMPMIANTMSVSQKTAYVGSFLGGPIYVQPVKQCGSFTFTVSGAVEYPHFILGYTGEEEYERLSRSTAPYFDLEVWDDSVRHSGPFARASQFDYAQLAQAALLWDKIARVSNEVPAGSGGDKGIIFLYDPFIAAGSMVAFVGRHTCNCPLNCLTAALDAESAVDDASDAFWGCIHEFNHHYQRFGFAPGDEVTNNAVSLAEYSLFTRISSNRAAGGGDGGKYATGWNRYTNPAWALRQTLSSSGKNSALDTYANLLHTFGPHIFIQATKNGGGSGGADAWYKAVSDAAQYDMTYYFRDLLHQNVSADVLQEYAAKNYPVFVPAACVYQTGRSFLRGGEKQYSRTAQPYGIPTGEPFTLDFAGEIVLPQGFSYTIKNVTNPAYGRLEKAENGNYIYTPDAAHRDSGAFCVTLGIEKEDGAFEAEDVDLVIELRQKQPDARMLERTVYTYDAGNMYESAAAAYENGYAGYAAVREEDNTNRVQNGNAEIWEPSPSSNAVMEIRGKFLISETGKYRVALRGRYDAALYISAGGEFERAAVLHGASGSPDFELTDAERYSDYEFAKGQWVQFKAVLRVTAGNCFVGVGLGKFRGDAVSVGYLNAYRSSYSREDFQTEYFYTHGYAGNYAEKPAARQTLAETNYRPWDDTYPVDNLFDEDDTNFIHSDRTQITASNPFVLAADLGETIRANRFTVYGEPSRAYQPKNFALYGGTSMDDLELIAEVENAPRTGSDVIVNFEERPVRCYKIVVTDTWSVGPKYIAFRRAEMSYSLDGGALVSPDDAMFTYRGNWQITNELATFGHLYEGQNASVEFAFEGTRFAVLACDCADYGAFEVLVDGEPVGMSDPRGRGAQKPVYLSELLPRGEHTIVIRSRSRFNVDSFIFWNE